MKNAESVEVWGTFRGNEWANKGEVVSVTDVGANGAVVWGFEVKATGTQEYFMARSGCEFPYSLICTLSRSRTSLLMRGNSVSPLDLLKNPMMLIAGAAMLVVFGMPYLMDNSESPLSSPFQRHRVMLIVIFVVDPELKAEFAERQKESATAGGQAANPLQNFDAAAWLAGASGSKKSESAVRSTEERGITR